MSQKPTHHDIDQATALIAHLLRELRANPHLMVPGRGAAAGLIHIYRLLTGGMPLVPGVDAYYASEELPAIEWASPTERDPNQTLYVYPAEGIGPDIVIEGDHNDQESTTPKALTSSRRLKA